MTDPITYAKVALVRLATGAIAWAGARWKKRSAAKRAFAGNDLAGQASFSHLVRVELTALAARSDLPDGLSSDAVRQWILVQPTETWVQVLLADASSMRSLGDEHRDSLARSYELITGDARGLAEGKIKSVLDYLAGQLNATTAGSNSLQQAIAIRTEAQVGQIARALSKRNDTEEELEKLRTLSERLLIAGRQRWCTPAFIAPLTLEVREVDAKAQQQSVTTEHVANAIHAGENIAIYGEGGIGKTTFLLELPSCCDGKRIPLYVDASVWAQSGLGLLDYRASLDAKRGSSRQSCAGVSSHHAWKRRHSVPTARSLGWRHIYCCSAHPLRCAARGARSLPGRMVEFQKKNHVVE